MDDWRLCVDNIYGSPVHHCNGSGYSNLHGKGAFQSTQESS